LTMILICCGIVTSDIFNTYKNSEIVLTYDVTVDAEIQFPAITINNELQFLNKYVEYTHFWLRNRYNFYQINYFLIMSKKFDE
jgi:Amiloride-sensitive sodium channel